MEIETQIDLDNKIIEKICEYTAMYANNTIINALEKSKKHKREKDLHNTKLLLENYRLFSGYIDNAVYKIEQIKDADTINWYKEFNTKGSKADAVVYSIKHSAVKSRLMVEHIKSMIDVYKKYCYEMKKTELNQRKYNILYYTYISEKYKNKEELSELYFVDVRTIQTNLKSAIEEFSALLFGLSYMD